LDVVATVEELTGVASGLVSDGRSLRPLFDDANAAWRSALLIEGGHDVFEGAHNGKKAKVARESWLGEGEIVSALEVRIANPAIRRVGSGGPAGAILMETPVDGPRQLRPCLIANIVVAASGRPNWQKDPRLRKFIGIKLLARRRPVCSPR
jgi:hypothetical protein